LPAGALLHLGDEAVIEVTGLRDPCRMLNRHSAGLMQAVTGRTHAGQAFFRGAVMAIVQQDGIVQTGDMIRVAVPPRPHRPLGIV
jgi:MOSC domain-containing protein YiiM